MKFQLVLLLCSSLYGDCKEPKVIDRLYNTHYDCASAGYLNSITALQALGESNVNELRLQVSFYCNELNES